MQELSTVEEVFTALGGNAGLVKLTKCPPKSVSMWKTNRAFPWKTQLVITEALRELRMTAPTLLWGMVGKGK
jgi:hypothetical protein